MPVKKSVKKPKRNAVKSDVKKIEGIASKLMRMDNKIWDKHKWFSGGMVNQAVHRAEVAKLVKPNSIPGVVGLILEDANYHTLNGALDDIGAFIDNPWTDKVHKIFRAYRNSEGKTWEL